MSFFDQSLIPYILFPFAGLFFSALLTRIGIRVLPKFKMVDAPRGRHQHEKPVPCGGGVAIGISFFIPLLILALLFWWENLSPLPLSDVKPSEKLFAPRENLSQLAGVWEFLRNFTLPAVLITIVGFIDDRFELRSSVKLFFQIVAGLIFYFEGCGISLLFYHELPEFVSLIITVLWCVTIINAFNLIDGLDGLAAGLGAISSFLLATWSVITGYNAAMVMVLLCFCMSCLGFLRYNFSPAKIFMGDTGSMFIGLFFAYVSMQYSTKAVTFAALLVPLAAVGVPIFDVFLAVWRRGMRKYIHKDENTAIMQGDHDHLHHRILKETGKTGKTALIIYGLAVMLSLLAMLNEFLRTSFPTLVFVLLLVAIFAMIRYSNIELYDTLSSVVKGVNVPHRNFILAALHPASDACLVLAALFLSSKVYGVLLPFAWNGWWYLLFLAPFVVVLCFSGIYRTFWLRAGILQYYKLARLLIAAGLLGYILNGAIWNYAMGLERESILSASSYYLVFWMFASGLILAERFVLHYYESFGYRRLFIRNQGKNSEIPKVLIYGGGLSCRMYISGLYCNFGKNVETAKIIGIMDDNPALRNLNVYGFKVHGRIDEISLIYERLKFDKVVIACETISPENIEKLKKFCAENKVELKKFICAEEAL